MPRNNTSNYDKHVKILLAPDDRYNTGVISWQVSSDTMEFIPLTAGEYVKVDEDLFADFMVGSKNNSFSMSIFACDQEGAAKEMKEIETLISQLVDFANAVAEASKHLPEKKEA